MTSAALFGTPSTVNTGFPVPSVNQMTSAALFGTPSTVNTGYPVASTGSQKSPVPIFGAASMTTTRFPVSSPKFGVDFGGSVKSTESIGFPVTHVDSKSDSALVFVTGSSSSVFSVGKDSGDRENKEQSEPISSVGFPITPVSSSPHVIFGASSNTAGYGFGADTGKQKQSPLKQIQPLDTTSSVFDKTFGRSEVPSKRTVISRDEKSPDEKTTITDISTLKSLAIREIPHDLNKNAWLRRFYSRFGEIVKVLCNPSKASATVTFRSHEAAKLAKVKGRILQK
ncbi:hypothetical protein QZH41_013107, partial [Actinostola sp. cb2023]